MDSNNMYQNQPEGGNKEPNPQPEYNTESNPQSVYGADGSNSYSGNTYDAYGNSSYNANSGYNTANNNYNTNNYNANTYNNGGGVYSQNAYSVDMEEPVSIGEWIIAMLIMMVPCVNIIMMFVFAFSSSSKKSKSNYFKAGLIMAGIVFAVYLVLIIILAAVGVASMY